MFQSNLRLLLEKIDEQHRNDILKNIVFSWINDKIEHEYLIDIFDFLQRDLNCIQQNEEDANNKNLMINAFII